MRGGLRAYHGAMPSVFTVLAAIPWAQVVESAPKIAQGATRLWETVRKRQAGPASPASPDASPPSAPDQLAQLQAQVLALQDEMRASAEVVKQLAEQNALLIQRMEATHQRFVRLALAGGVCVAGLAAAVLYLLAAR